jgi:hypothetical protein
MAINQNAVKLLFANAIFDNLSSLQNSTANLIMRTTTVLEVRYDTHDNFEARF